MMSDVLLLREEGRSSSPGPSDTVAELANTVSRLHDALNKFLLVRSIGFIKIICSAARARVAGCHSRRRSL